MHNFLREVAFMNLFECRFKPSDYWTAQALLIETDRCWSQIGILLALVTLCFTVHHLWFHLSTNENAWIDSQVLLGRTMLISTWSGIHIKFFNFYNKTNIDTSIVVITNSFCKVLIYRDLGLKSEPNWLLCKWLVHRVNVANSAEEEIPV